MLFIIWITARVIHHTFTFDFRSRRGRLYLHSWGSPSPRQLIRNHLFKVWLHCVFSNICFWLLFWVSFNWLWNFNVFLLRLWRRFFVTTIISYLNFWLFGDDCLLYFYWLLLFWIVLFYLLYCFFWLWNDRFLWNDFFWLYLHFKVIQIWSFIILFGIRVSHFTCLHNSFHLRDFLD